MQNYIIALDSGTTSNRAILFNRSGEIAGVVQEEFDQIFPRPGWVEHDPWLIWESLLKVTNVVIEQHGVTPAEIAGIGITNQRETTLVWNRDTGEPVYNAIVWQDRRTAGICDELKEHGFERIFYSKTGLVPDSYFSGTKIKWILDNVEGTREQAETGQLAFGTIDSWLIWNLTRGKLHITDVTNASRTLLFNIHTLKWDNELLRILDIPESLLPDVKQSSEVYGKINGSILGAEIALAGIAGDQQAALFGQMCIEKGMIKNTYGTGCFVVMNTGNKPIKSKHKLLSTIAWQINNKTTYAVEGSIFTAGALVQWLRDQLGIIDSSSEIENLALKVENSGGISIVPAMVGLGAPHWDSYATGTIIGLSRGSGRAHIARAALESIALRTMEVIEAMTDDTGIEVHELRVDGGAAINNLLLQLQANAINAYVIRPEITETTALGAAYLAGLATGFWTMENLKAQWKVERRFEPDENKEYFKEVILNWRKAVERSKRWYDDR